MTSPIVVAKPKRASATEYVITLNVSFATGRHSFRPWRTLCTSDTESRDGFGLPGHHHCGAKRISWKAANTYIG